MNKKNIIKVVFISLFIFIFIGLMSYIIYVYGISDKKNKDNMLTEFNDGNYSYVYNKFNIKDETKFINEDKFNDVISLMYDKTYLNELYKAYYVDLYEDKDKFFDDYYFGYNDVTIDDIEFDMVGKTSLFKRSDIYYKYINVVNKNKVKSSLGIYDNVAFNIDGNGELYIDDVLVSCADNVCKVDKIFGGFHKVSYSYQDELYFGIVNIGYDTKFNVKNVLHDVSGKGILEDNKNISSVSLNTGTYVVGACYMESGCPNSRYSYIDLRDDGTVTMYIYISLDISGDTYEGTYEVKNGFLYLNFDRHVYKMHDYDTKTKTDIEGNLDIEMIFKIDNSYQISNYDYMFYKK